MGFNRAQSEAAPVLLQHLSLVLIGSIGLYEVFGNRTKMSEMELWKEDCFQVILVASVLPLLL